MSEHWLQRRMTALSEVARRGSAKLLHGAAVELVDALGKHPAVVGAMASREGLLVARCGSVDIDHDGLAALGGALTSSARAVAPRLGIGPLEQVVLSGPQGKVALFVVDELTLAIVGAPGTHLGSALAVPPDAA